MLGDFVNNVLVCVLGYVYPAVECFKTIESSRSDASGLRFWCQYWVILAMLTAIDKFGDLFISWLPLYGEFKLAFIVYLWHPRTLGTRHVYETLLRPFMAQHETDIERRLQMIMSKSSDVFLFYIKNFADKGQSMAFEILQYVISRGSRSSPYAQQNVERQGDGGRLPRQPGPPPAPLQATAPPLPPSPRRHRHPSPTPPASSRTPLYPTIDGVDEDLQPGVNRVEEALRAAGVNLRKLRPHNNNNQDRF